MHRAKGDRLVRASVLPVCDNGHNRKYASVGSLISSRQEYPNLLRWEINVPAQRSRSLYELSFSEASRYPGKRTNVYHHR